MLARENKTPINQGTLADQVFDYLSTAILRGELRAGERLVEVDLAEKLGISRGPVREALVELEVQGLAYSEVRRGTFVKPWTKADLWEVAILRATLEALAAQLAAPHLTDEDLAYLESLSAEMEDAEHKDDLARLIDLDFAFHGMILERCKHERLQQMLDNMRLQIKLFRIITRATDYLSYPEMHRNLLDSLTMRDPERAYQAVHSHIMESAETALATLEDDKPLTIGETPLP